ncbi:MAG: porin family protein [Prevotella sp.]|nr:porin family protein [Prevotella sp.]
MKRLFTLVVLLSALTVATQAQGIKFGVKGGFDIQKMEFDATVFDTENKLGWFIGPTLQVGLPIGGLGVDIAAFYDQKSTEVNGESVKQKYVLVPINARLKLGLGSTAGLYVAAGPQFAFNVGDTDFDVLKTSTYENTFQLKKSAFSVNLGAGVYLSDHLEVGFVYNIGVSSTAEASWKSATDAAFHEDSTKPKSWQISATYFF